MAKPSAKTQIGPCPLLNPLKPLQARRTLATLAALAATQFSFAGSAVIDLGSERYRDAGRAYKRPWGNSIKKNQT